MSGEIVRAQQIALSPSGVPSSLEEVRQVAEILFRGGLAPTARDVAQVAAKVLVGRELGIAPFASVAGIDMIEGKPCLSANMQAALLRRAGYDYRVTEHTDDVCAIEVSRGGKPLGPPVTFSREDAKRANLLGKAVWQKFPRNMLFARAMSNAVAFLAPDATCGVRTYAEGEIEPAAEAPRLVEALGPTEIREIERRSGGRVVEPVTPIEAARAARDALQSMGDELEAALSPAKPAEAPKPASDDAALRAVQDAARAKAAVQKPAPSLAESLNLLGLGMDGVAGAEILGPLDGKALAESYTTAAKACAQRLGRERATALVRLVGAGKIATLAQVRALVLAAGAEVRS